jgi:DNA modification methylase
MLEKDNTYDHVLINEKVGGKHSQLLTYNVVVRKLTYEENDLNGEIVNIYQKPQALINYFIDTFSSEGDWILDLFLGSCKIYDIIDMKAYFNLYHF